MQHPVRLALPLLLLTACGKVEVTVDGGVDPDASEFSDGGVDPSDTDPPDTAIESAPVSPSGSVSASFVFSASEPGCTFLCQLDSAAPVDCEATHDLEVSTDGPHWLEVRAVDGAGNQDPTPARHDWTVDTRDPVVTVSSGPSDPTSDTDATLEFTADEPATFDCRRDGGSWQPCDGSASYNGLAEGDHLFEARATDPAGNQGIGTWAWTVDADAPSIEILTHPANPTSSTSAAFTFAAEAGATVACRIDSGSFGACTSPTTMNYPSLAGNVSHTFRVRATDAASNSAVATFTWTIDTAPPDTLLDAAPANPYPIDWADFAFHSDDAAATYECNLDGGGWQACASPIGYTKLGYGGHQLRVRGTDALGNVEQSPAIHEWTATPGLILHFPFDGSLKNASPLGGRFDGDGGGFDFTSGYRDGAVRFAAGEVKVPQTAALLSNDVDYTIAMWVAEAGEQIDLEYRYLFTTAQAGGGLAGYRYNSRDYELWAVFSGTTANGGTKHNFNLNQGWRHIIYEHDGNIGKGGDVRVYVNNVLAGTIANPSSAIIFNENQLESLLIGGNSRFIIDDMRVYNRVFTLPEKCEQILGGVWVDSSVTAPYCKL